MKNTQIYSLLNCLGGSSVCFGSIETLCFGIEAKQPKQTVSKQTEKTKKKNGKTLYFLKNMLRIKLFWLVFCLFRFNRNIETLCFDIESKQPKQTFCFG